MYWRDILQTINVLVTSKDMNKSKWVAWFCREALHGLHYFESLLRLVESLVRGMLGLRSLPSWATLETVIYQPLSLYSTVCLFTSVTTCLCLSVQQFFFALLYGQLITLKSVYNTINSACSSLKAYKQFLKYRKTTVRAAYIRFV